MATSLNVSVKTVTAVASGISRSMRVVRKEQAVHLTASLTVELEHCATVYCGAIKTGDNVFEEATEFIFSQFGHLGVYEIREAFRLAAAGQFGDEVDLKAYYGVFSIVALGAVLKAYDIYRVRIVKEIRKREIEALNAQEEAQKAVNWNTAAWQADRRQTLLGLTEPGVQYITAYDYHWLSRVGEIEPTKEEKEQAWVRAKQIVLEDYQALAVHNQTFRRALADVMNGTRNDGFYNRRVAMMKRLLVLGWIERQRLEKEQMVNSL